MSKKSPSYRTSIFKPRYVKWDNLNNISKIHDSGKMEVSRLFRPVILGKLLALQLGQPWLHDSDFQHSLPSSTSKVNGEDGRKLKDTPGSQCFFYLPKVILVLCLGKEVSLTGWSNGSSNISISSWNYNSSFSFQC